MAKNLKINIKNTQIAQAVNLGNIKSKLAKKKDEAETPPKDDAVHKASKEAKPVPAVPIPASEEAPRIKARSKSAFAEGSPEVKKTHEPLESESKMAEESVEEEEKATSIFSAPPIQKTPEELRQELFGDDDQIEENQTVRVPPPPIPTALPKATPPKPFGHHHMPVESEKEKIAPPPLPVYEKLGPTGKHIKDFLPVKPAPKKPEAHPAPRPPERGREQTHARTSPPKEATVDEKNKALKAKAKGPDGPQEEANQASKAPKTGKFKEFRDIKPPVVRRGDDQRSFDVRDRQGLRQGEEESKPWRKKRQNKRIVQEDLTIRPDSLKIRTPIAIKDLAAEMKLKSSQLIQKLFMQGIVATLNDLLEDETTIQLLGQEFGCEIQIDTSEEERIRITDKSIKDEIRESPQDQLHIRPPVVAFMGHVDHGKTSLIDAIRKTNRAAGEAGAITQHIGAFRCRTPVGDIAILDTPGHEAFSAMRSRGADVTDIVVLVVAGDEGIRQQTIEAIQHAKTAGVTIVVAINKSDKPNFNVENVYRQLSEQELLPEAWGGQTITVNCSAVSGQGIKELLEMLALQAEVLEIRANPQMRARGSVLESEMHKGLGSVGTVLIQNGTLRLGDAVVFGELWGRVKTMRDEFGRELTEAGPSTPVEITGLSGLPEAGQEFIVVKSEREAREIAEARQQGSRQTSLQQKKKLSMESMLQQASEVSKKMLNLVLRADVQGSLEALKIALQKIESVRAELTIIYAGVGEISESDIQLAAASKAVVIGFHTAIESHAESLIRQLGVEVRLHDIIYHAIDDVKLLMAALLDKIAIETDKGKAEVKATFKSSHHGVIAGCIATEGTIQRNNQMRLKRNGEMIWKGPIASLKRVKEDVREVQKGVECGILLNGFSDFQVGDILEAFEVTYIAQEL